MRGAGLVIIGGSYAACQIAATAREAGYAEPITLLSDEADTPYQRPPLSKGFLTGKIPQSALSLRADAFYRDAAVELRLGKCVTAINRCGKRIETADGGIWPYDRLALATGARARRLSVPGADLDGVVSLRSLADARALRDRVADAQSIVIVGGGFIGLELASAFGALGCGVTILELQERLLLRAVTPAVAAFLAEVHQAKGVRLIFNAAVQEIRGERGRASAVIGRDGEYYAADLVVLGVGAVPNSELAEACGLGCSDGILVDRFARTSDPDIVAAGDCTRHPNAFAGCDLRLESVQHALDHAKTAGATIAEAPKPYDAVPWFWSEQHEIKLQMAGLSQGHDAAIPRGSIGSGRFSIFAFKRDRLTAVDSINRPADHILARKLLAQSAAVTPGQAADPDFDLASLLRPPRQ